MQIIIDPLICAFYQVSFLEKKIERMSENVIDVSDS